MLVARDQESTVASGKLPSKRHPRSLGHEKWDVRAHLVNENGVSQRPGLSTIFVHDFLMKFNKYQRVRDCASTKTSRKSRSLVEVYRRVQKNFRGSRPPTVLATKDGRSTDHTITRKGVYEVYNDLSKSTKHRRATKRVSRELR